MNGLNSITYRLKQGQKEFEYRLEFDLNGLIVKGGGLTAPAWTKIGVHQCPHCPYNEAQTPHCPVAVNIAQFVADWRDTISFEALELTVTTPQRTIVTPTTLQSALRSVLGLVVAGSDCEHMAFFRLMSRHHLPLADSEETVTRAVSFYLLREFLANENQGVATVRISGLSTVYENAGIVNQSLSKRLQSLDIEDSVVNAIVSLDSFGKTVVFSLQDSLMFLRTLFPEELLGRDGK